MLKLYSGKPGLLKACLYLCFNIYNDSSFGCWKHVRYFILTYTLFDYVGHIVILLPEIIYNFLIYIWLHFLINGVE